MKTKILIAAAAAATAALVACLVKNSRTNSSETRVVPAPKSHHLTNIFAQAKKHTTLIQSSVNGAD